MSFLESVLRGHRALPRYLRVWFVVPATIVLIMVLGLTFTLPSGPLCDEGMILFMEGGCDWGESNVFFFSKVGLLVALNVTLVLAWRARAQGVVGFVPHFAVLALVAVTNLSAGYCDTYYSHPNGSIGQMAFEGIALAFLGSVILRIVPRHRLAALLAWNAAYPAVFYAALPFANHWTWMHTFMVMGGLFAVAGVLVRTTSAASA